MSADVANMALDAARRQGIDVDELLRAAGINASSLGSPLSRVTSDQASAVLRHTWDLTGDELFGLGREPMPRGSFRMVAFTLVNAVELGFRGGHVDHRHQAGRPERRRDHQPRRR
ncbi:AraC family transcriptional regulator ligand-binding domain-containing protein [Aeromicrobium sp. P5_D10]